MWIDSKFSRFHHVGGHALIGIQARGDVAHHVLDELRIVVGALGDVLLVRALEDAVQLAGGFALGDLDQLLDPDVLRSFAVMVTCERWLWAP